MKTFQSAFVAAAVMVPALDAFHTSLTGSHNLHRLMNTRRLSMSATESSTDLKSFIPNDPKMTYATLNNGYKIPMLGFGTWRAEPGEVEAAVYEAIKTGYTHIDCAYAYGNHKEVGNAMKRAFDEGLIKRENLFVTSKLWNSQHEPAEVEGHTQGILDDLQLDYLDLYEMHFPVVEGYKGEVLKPSVKETWQAMEKLVDKGMVRTLGVSNFSANKVKAMKEYAKYFPAVNQCEMHPVWKQEELIKEMADLGVHMTAYSPLGSSGSSGEEFHTKDVIPVLQQPILAEVAKECGKSVAQVCVRWAFQRGTSVIPKSVKPERIAQNFDVINWSLTEEQMKKVSSITPQARMLNFNIWLSPEGPYKTMDDLWVK